MFGGPTSYEWVPDWTPDWTPHWMAHWTPDWTLKGFLKGPFGLDENIQQDEERNEKANAISNEHKKVDFARVLILVVNDMSNDLLLANIAVRLFNDVENHVRQVVVRLSKFGHDAWIVAAGHDFAVLV